MSITSNFSENKSIEIRLAQDSDLDVIFKNEKAAYDIPWSEKLLKDCLDSRYTCWLMLQNKRPIGHMIFQKVLDEIHLHNVCVNPQFQKNGYGSLWIDHLYGYAKKNLVKDIILEVRVSNLTAKKLYAKRGFREIGLRKGYYKAKDGKEDALVMKAHLEELCPII